MAKLSTPKQSSAPGPGAAPLPLFRVNWLFTGFREVDLHQNDVVEATEAEVAPYVGNVLSRIEPEA